MPDPEPPPPPSPELRQHENTMVTLWLAGARKVAARVDTDPGAYALLRDMVVSLTRHEMAAAIGAMLLDEVGVPGARAQDVPADNPKVQDVVAALVELGPDLRALGHAHVNLDANAMVLIARHLMAKGLVPWTAGQ